jgi:hypothetical protein
VARSDIVEEVVRNLQEVDRIDLEDMSYGVE